MLNPLDVLARAAAIPAIVVSAADALIDLRRRWSDDSTSGLRARLSDGYFERIEERFRTRWAELFPADASDDADRAA